MNHTGTEGLVYASSRKLSVSDQLLVARKLGPATPIMQGIVDKENADKDMTLILLMALATLPDDASDTVTAKCLSVVTAADMDGKQVPIRASNGAFMFKDVSMPDVLHLTAKVIEENLGDFFRTALGSLAAEAAKAKAAASN